MYQSNEVTNLKIVISWYKMSKTWIRYFVSMTKVTGKKDTEKDLKTADGKKCISWFYYRMKIKLFDIISSAVSL